jgi:hypothetical protein
MSNRFHSIIDSYLKEAGENIQISPQDQSQIQKAEQTGPASQALGKITNALVGQPRNDGEKVLHTLATNPNINKIEDAYKEAKVSPESALPFLIKMGLNPATNNNQQQANAQKQTNTPQQKTTPATSASTPNTSTTTNSTTPTTQQNTYPGAN